MTKICKYGYLLLTMIIIFSCKTDFEKYFALLSTAERSPIIEKETPEGFRFDMDKDAFYQKLNQYNTYEEHYQTFYDKQIGEDIYQCQIQYDFEDEKLCSHGFWIESKKINDSKIIVGEEDVANIVRYYKEALKDGYKYYKYKLFSDMYSHVFAKNNLVIEIRKENNLPIIITFENRPITAKVEKAKRNEFEESRTIKQDADVKNSSWDGSVKQVKDYLKYNYLRDPDSYESIEWSEVKRKDDGYYVRHKYRAKNGFGGYVVANQLFHLDFSGNVVDVKDLY